jgi:hypothetical protein
VIRDLRTRIRQEDEVRNYVRRLRKILADLVNKPGRGYSLVFRAT